jgi:glyoxylase-like metal-dependent hydrolase (beta-lactamase superfamily II)
LALGQSAESRVIANAAAALGGRDRILALKTLKIEGYGQLAYQNGGGNITTSPDAPQKWVNINAYQRILDLEHNRMRLEQTQVQDFVFAYARNMTGIAAKQGFDNGVAFNIGADGKAARASDAAARARRMEMLANPVAIVRAALDPYSKLSGLHKSGTMDVIDIAPGGGDRITLAVDADTHLPSSLSWTASDTNLGDVTYRTYFLGYENEKGLRLPYGFNTTMDFRNVVWQKLWVDHYTIDGPSEDLAAPAAVRAASTPQPAAPVVEAVPVAKGIWYLRSGQGNSTLYEFNDHLTLFECYGSEALCKAVIEKARATVPAKPLTEVIVSHHHFDHSGGLRAAVAEGLTIITQRGNADFFPEVTARPAKMAPDALARNPKPIRIRPVDDHLKLQDSSMEVDVYRVVANNHMADGVFAYVPRDRLVSEGDLVDEGWDVVWWGNSYPESVQQWKLTVEKDLPVHGNIHTYAEVIQMLRQQTRNAQDLCRKVDAASLTMRGCPVRNFP